MKISKYLYFYQGARNYIGGSSCNTFLIYNEYGILIDPGTVIEQRAHRLIRAIERDGIDLSKIKSIWITHAHPDHIQLAQTLARDFNWKVYCHQEAKSIIDSEHPTASFLKREFGVVKQYAHELMPLFELHLAVLLVDTIYGKWRRTNISGVFEGNEVIQNGDLIIKITPVPGHCPIDLSFWMPQERTLIMGDLIDPRRKQPVPVFNNPSSSLNQALTSLKLILSLKPVFLGLGHGRCLEGTRIIEDLARQNLERALDYKVKALEFIRSHGEYKLIDLGRAIESYRGLSTNGKVMLAFVALRALKEDGSIT